MTWNDLKSWSGAKALVVKAALHSVSVRLGFQSDLHKLLEK